MRGVEYENGGFSFSLLPREAVGQKGFRYRYGNENLRINQLLVQSVRVGCDKNQYFEEESKICLRCNPECSEEGCTGGEVSDCRSVRPRLTSDNERRYYQVIHVFHQNLPL